MKGVIQEENETGKNPSIDIIVAVDNAGGIGLKGEIPWQLEKEWQHFLKLTTRYSTLTHHVLLRTLVVVTLIVAGLKITDLFVG